MSPQRLIWGYNESFWTFTPEIMVFQVVVEVTSLVTWQDLEFPLLIIAQYLLKTLIMIIFFKNITLKCVIFYTAIIEFVQNY